MKIEGRQYVLQSFCAMYRLMHLFRVDVEIVDTAGQEDFAQIRRLGYQGANVLIICYAVSNLASFRNIREIVIDFFAFNLYFVISSS